jgi:ribonuclease HI
VAKKDKLTELEQVHEKAMSVPGRGIARHDKTLPQYDITNDDWCVLHKNKATNTLKVWTDGGHTNGETTAGVYVRERFKDSIHMLRGGSSFMGELVGVLVALEQCPHSCNLEIMINCTSTVKAITGFNSWKKGRQMRTDSRGAILHINRLITERQAAGYEVHFTYVPSHVKEKGSRAATEGAKAVELWESKMAALQDEHRIDLDLLIQGNEAADKLATLARHTFSVMYNRSVVTSHNGVAMLHFNRSLVEQGLRQTSIKAEAENKFQQQARRVSRGEYLQDSNTDFKRSGVGSNYGN